MSISSKIVDYFIKLKLRNKIIAIIIPVTLLAAWQQLGSLGYINQSILPVPTKVWSTLIDMIESGKLQKHILVSCSRVLKGFCIGVGLGLTVGMLIGLFRPVEIALGAMIGIFRPIPAIACVPILILMFGIGEISKISVIAIGSFWPVLLNTIQGMKSTDIKLLEVSTIFEKSRLKTLVKVVIPSAMPSIITGLRLGVSSSWTCVVTAEMIAASSGVGFLITYARELAQPDLLLVGIASIGFIGLIIDLIVLKLQSLVLYWNAAPTKGD